MCGKHNSPELHASLPEQRWAAAEVHAKIASNAMMRGRAHLARGAGRRRRKGSAHTTSHGGASGEGRKNKRAGAGVANMRGGRRSAWQHTRDWFLNATTPESERAGGGARTAARARVYQSPPPCDACGKSLGKRARSHTLRAACGRYTQASHPRVADSRSPLGLKRVCVMLLSQTPRRACGTRAVGIPPRSPTPDHCCDQSM